jgi:hypothetical protein
MPTSITEISQSVGDPPRRSSGFPEADRTSSRTKPRIAFGVFLVVLGAYVLSSPGRIDIVDGQARFDVSYNWLVIGRPVVRDNWIGPVVAVPGRNGVRYSYYGAPGSIFGMPLVWLGLHSGLHSIPSSQFSLLFNFLDLRCGCRASAFTVLFATWSQNTRGHCMDNGQ